MGKMISRTDPVIHNAWYKVGKHPDLGYPEEITFRMYNDIGNWNRSKSYHWVKWKINQEQEFIGEMSEKSEESTLHFFISPPA